MFHDGSFSTLSFDDRSWLFALDAAYPDLSEVGRIYVRTVLEYVYSAPVAEQIIAVAEERAISVIAAADAVVVSPAGDVIAASVSQRAAIVDGAKKIVHAVRVAKQIHSTALPSETITASDKESSRVVSTRRSKIIKGA